MVRCKPPGTGFAFLPSGVTRLCCALIFLIVVEASSAAIWVWTGNGGNVNWDTAGNWNPGTVPTSASTTDLTFAGANNVGTLAVPLNQNISTEFQLNRLTFDSTAGSFFLGGGSLSFNGANRIITQHSSNAQSIANNIIGGINSTVVLTLAGNGAGLVTLSGTIIPGSGNRDYAITKTGMSTFSLTGANNYGGLTTISAGALDIRHATALGSTASGTTVASGAALQIQGNINVATEALTLNGSGIAGEGAFRNMSGNNSFAGAITLNTTSTIGSDYGTLTLSGVISGTGGLTKTGGGTLMLSGPASNTYTGSTTVSGGTLILAKPIEVADPAITIGGAGASATVQLGAAYQLYGAATTINAGGQLDLNNFTEYVGTLTVSGGSVITGSGLLYIGGGITSNANSATTTLAGNYSLYTNQTFNIASGPTPTGEDVIISGPMAEVLGGTTITKQGAGKLVLSGANTYTGLTTISAGILNIRNSTALGTTAGGTTVSSGASLQIQGNIIVGNEALTLNGSGTGGTGAFRNISGNNSFSGAVTLGSASTISSDAGTLTLTGGITNAGFTTTFTGAGSIAENGVISGTGGVTKTGGGTVTLGGANTFTGSTTVSAGTLQVNTNNALGTAASGTTVANGAVLRLNNVTYSTAETLTLNGSGIGNGGALANTGTSTFAGPITIATNATINAGGGVLTLTGGLDKNGTTLTIAGGGSVYINNNGITGSSPNSDLVVDGTTVILNAANSYNGPTTVQNSGTLQLGNNNVLPTSPQTALTVNSNSVFNLASRSDSVASLSGDSSATVRNSVIGSTSTLTINPANGVTTTFSGGIVGTNVGTQGDIALHKSGAGTLILAGGNSYSGATTISGGTLTAAASSGSALKSTSSITVNSGGTLMLGANNQINDTAPITLAGGTFSAGNFSEGTDFTPGLGALTLTASSLIDFGSGAGAVLTLAGFTPGSFTLTISNWTGNPETIGNGTTDRLIFTSDQSANLGSFVFTGYAPGAMEIDLGNGYYEITPMTPVPEPSTYFAAALALAAIGFQQRRRLRRLLSPT